jgi:hypothetical protein
MAANASAEAVRLRQRAARYRRLGREARDETLKTGCEEMSRTLDRKAALVETGGIHMDGSKAEEAARRRAKRRAE